MSRWNSSTRDRGGRHGVVVCLCVCVCCSKRDTAMCDVKIKPRARRVWRSAVGARARTAGTDEHASRGAGFGFVHKNEESRNETPARGPRINRSGLRDRARAFVFCHFMSSRAPPFPDGGTRRRRQSTAVQLAPGAPSKHQTAQRDPLIRPTHMMNTPPRPLSSRRSVVDAPGRLEDVGERVRQLDHLHVHVGVCGGT